MSDDPVISVRHVSKAYRIWESPAARLTSPVLEGAGSLFPARSAARTGLHARAARHYRDFYALHDVSFEVRRGECWGIVGRNGSGKSTLLQIIAGTLQPTTGSVQVNGRVAALLELGSGFNPEFTGRENVQLNGAVLGLTREEIGEKFAGIAAFADIGEFMEQPVKTYSSGMLMRLAFAVQTAVDPAVLIIDEALSVGDAPFQAKCFARLRHLLDGGCTILFVSHDVGVVRTFCHRAVWLQQGRAEAQGAAPVVCDAYNRDCFRAMGMDFAEDLHAPAEIAPAAATTRSSLLQEDRTEFQKLAALERRGTGTIQLRNFFFLAGKANQRTAVIGWDETATAVYIIGSPGGYDGLFQCGLVCKTIQGQELLCCSDRRHDLRLRLAPGEEAVVTMRTQLPLRSGQYVVTTGLFLFPEGSRFPTGTYDFTRSTVADFIPCSAVVNIPPQFALGIYGPVQMESQLALPAG
jgi:ABC-type polysaccharide/polyol phosphate transport system ATPase subunit